MARDIAALVKRLPIVESLVRRPPGLYWHLRRSLEQEDRLGPDAREARQRERLERTIRRARGARHYAGMAPDAGLGDVPLLDRQALRSDPGAFLTSGHAASARATTSGTTGVPLVLRRSFSSVVFEQATIDHLVAGCGVEPSGARTAVLRADPIKAPDDREPPYWISPRPDRLVMSAGHLAPETAPAFVEALRSFRPQILHAYPSALMALLGAMEEADETLSIPVCVTSSESINPALAQWVGARFGGHHLDIYGQAERVALASAVDGGGYRFRPDYGAVEFLPGEHGLELVATGLRNRTQPLLRYRTGDIVALPDPDAARRVALGLATFGGISGRSEEFFRLANGARIIGMNHVCRDLPGVASAQIVQHDYDALEMIVVPGAGFGNTSIARIHSKLDEKFPSHVRRTITFAGAPRRTPSGKVVLFSNEMEARP